MFDFDKAVKVTLRTWYPIGHSYHLAPHHPLGKLAGEWGELYDDYYKFLYKPGYKFEPLESGELGDIWYYLRILCYQCNHSLNTVILPRYQDLDSLIEDAAEEAFRANKTFRKYKQYSRFCLDLSYRTIVEIGRQYAFDLQQLTDSNWEKLKPGSVRGDEWEKAKVNTDYAGGKVVKK
jgi:hypothetical protein